MYQIPHLLSSTFEFVFHGSEVVDAFRQLLLFVSPPRFHVLDLASLRGRFTHHPAGGSHSSTRQPFVTKTYIR